MQQRKIVFAICLFIVAKNSFGQTGLTSSEPTIEFTTQGGQRIITVYNASGTIGGGRVIKGQTHANGFTVTVGVKQQNNVPVAISLDRTNITGSGFQLELNINKQWKPVPVSISIIRELAPVVQFTKPEKPDFTKTKEPGLLLQLSDAKKSFFGNARDLTIRSKINEAIRNREFISAETSPVINDWFPKDTGAIGGSFIVTGKNLDSVKHVQIGEVMIPIARRIKNDYLEAVIVQLPAQAIKGDLSLVYPVRIANKRTTVPMRINSDYTLVDQFSSNWPDIRATIINISPAPDFADRPHALREYHYQILFEYVPGNVVSKFEWMNNTRVSNRISDRSGFRPSHKTGFGFSSETFTGSGTQDASGGTFITGNMFIGSLSGTIHSVVNTILGTNTEIQYREARINIQVSSFLNSNSQSGTVTRKIASAAFNYNTPRKFIINNTESLRSELAFDKLYSHGTTSGVSTGQSDFNVGLINQDGDISFRIASGPLGTEAVWVSTPFMMSDGWQITQFNWKEKLVFPGDYAKARAQTFNTLVLQRVLFGSFMKDLEGCRNFDVYRSINNNPPYNYHSKEIADRSVDFFFNPEFAEESLTCNPYMRADPNSYRGHMDRQNVKGIFVNLKAEVTGTNDHRVILVLESVELLGPRGGDVATAFADIQHYNPLLRPSAGYIIGIAYPEFFKLLGL